MRYNSPRFPIGRSARVHCTLYTVNPSCGDHARHLINTIYTHTRPSCGHLHPRTCITHPTAKATLASNAALSLRQDRVNHHYYCMPAIIDRAHHIERPHMHVSLPAVAKSVPIHRHRSASPARACTRPCPDYGRSVNTGVGRH